MKQRWKVWVFPAACSFWLFPLPVSGQQHIQPQWQHGISPPLPSFQSSGHWDSSQKSTLSDTQPANLDDHQPPLVSDEQPVHQSSQAATPDAQETMRPSTQPEMEIPAVWPQAPSPVSQPGYLGIKIRDFYRGRFCMHAMTVQGVEVAAIDHESPAERAGLRPARGLSAREVAAATVAGLLTMSPAAALAEPVLRAAGGMNHGDIILAVGGKRVKTQDQFQHELARFGPHTVVHLTIRRSEAVVQLPVRLDDWPSPTPAVSLQQVRTTAGN